MTTIMKGKEVAIALKEKIKAGVAELKEKGKVTTCGFIRVGDRSDSIGYENAAIKVLSSLGIECVQFHYPEDITEADFISELEKIGNDDSVDGFLLLRPLPAHIDDDLVGMKINPKKDIDGVSPYNIGEVFYPKEDSFIPCTAAAVIKMLEFYDLDLTGKNAVVLGRSNVIGKPVAMLLLAKNATVTVCHSRTQNLKEVCKNADVLVSAIGKAHFVTKEFVKEGAIVDDVGTNYDENGKVTGDVDFDEVSEIASYINPVPGGIGSITTSVLAEKCLIAARKKVK